MKPHQIERIERLAADYIALEKSAYDASDDAENARAALEEKRRKAEAAERRASDLHIKRREASKALLRAIVDAVEEDT